MKKNLYFDHQESKNLINKSDMDERKGTATLYYHRNRRNWVLVLMGQSDYETTVINIINKGHTSLGIMMLKNGLARQTHNSTGHN